MLHNYHTHTWRCNHADGTEREYIENAIRMGMKTLGFSDHAGWKYPGDYCNTSHMRHDQLLEYCETIAALKEEYKGRIDIKIGFETEYYLPYFEEFMEMIAPLPVDYMILGHHANGGEIGFRSNCLPTDSEESLALYVCQVLAGLHTGCFSYLAHPDFFNFSGDDTTYRRYMVPFCKEIRRMGIPLEMNLLGLRNGRNYPSERFFAIAAEVGNDVILGIDAHQPEAILHGEMEARALAFLRRFGITPLEKLELRPPKR